MQMNMNEVNNLQVRHDELTRQAQNERLAREAKQHKRESRADAQHRQAKSDTRLLTRVLSLFL